MLQVSYGELCVLITRGSLKTWWMRISIRELYSGQDRHMVPLVVRRSIFDAPRISPLNELTSFGPEVNTNFFLPSSHGNVD
jgi:hypothetical protein